MDEAHQHLASGPRWVQGLDLNQGPSGYEPDELPDCSTLQHGKNVISSVWLTEEGETTQNRNALSMSFEKKLGKLCQITACQREGDPYVCRFSKI